MINFDAINQIISQPNLQWLFHLAAFWIGACLGSFLNVCIWRIPRNEDVVYTPSHCPGCQKPIRWYDNVPIFAWLILRGKCRDCQWPIPFRYFGFELAMGLLIWFCWAKVSLFKTGTIQNLPIDITLIMLAVATFFIDLKHRIIPNEITYSALFLGFLFSSLFLPHNVSAVYEHAFISPNWLNNLFQTAIPVAFSLVFLILVRWGVSKLVNQEALGWGDIKYIIAIAALTNFHGLFFILLIASFTATCFELWIICRRYFRGRRHKLSAVIPFGPFLATATLLWVISNYWICGKTIQLITFLQQTIHN